MLRLILILTKLILSLLLFIEYLEASSQILKINDFSEKIQITSNDSIIFLSKKFIINGSEKIYLDEKKIDNYELDEINGKIYLHNLDLSLSNEIFISYQYLTGITNKIKSIISTFDTINNKNPLIDRKIDNSNNDFELNSFPIAIDGTFSRKVDFSSSSSTALNGGLKLNIQGKLLDDMIVNAVLSDQNIPIQSQGNTKSLNEFDKLFIEIITPNSIIKAGDIDFKNSNSNYQNHFKRLEGMSFSSNFSNLKFEATTGTSRGKFHSIDFNGIDQNQGPYPLYGLDGSRKILITPNSESIWINGIKMARGESNDYLIDYYSSEIIFTPKNIININSRIHVEFEYHDFGFQRDFTSTSFETKNEKFNFKINFIDEKDKEIENNPINFSSKYHELNNTPLNDEHLSQIDSLGNYIKISNPDNLNDSIYFYSPKSLYENYKVTFINYGINGEYSKQISDDGNIYYEYITLTNRTNLIELYSPYVKKINPQKHNVTSFISNYKINDLSEFNVEIATSNLKENINLKVKPSSGIASNLSFNSKIILPFDIGNLSFHSKLKNSGKNFFSHQNNNDIEFWRERNLNKKTWDLNINEGLGYQFTDLKIILNKDKRYDSTIKFGGYSDFYQKSKNFDFNTSYNGELIRMFKFNFTNAKTNSTIKDNSIWTRKKIDLKILKSSLSPVISYNEELRTKNTKFYESLIGLEFQRNKIISNIGFIKRDDFNFFNNSFDLISSGLLSNFEIKSKGNKNINGSLIFKNQIKKFFNNQENLNYNLSRGFFKYNSKNKNLQSSLDFLLERNLFEEKIIVYEFIGKGLGNYRFDSNSQIYLFDQFGDYLSYSIPSGIKSPSTHFLSNFRFNKKFSTSKNKYLRSTTLRFYFKTDYNGTKISYENILNPSHTINDLKSSRLTVQTDIRYVPKNSFRRMGLKIIKNHQVIANTLQPYKDEKNSQIKFNFEEPITNKIIFNSELNYFNTDFKSSQISLSRKSVGWYIDSGFNFKLLKLINYGIDFVYGNENGSFGLFTDEIETSGLEFNSIIFFKKNARIDANIFFYNISFANKSFNSLPPELARGFQPGFNTKSTISTIFNINNEISLNFNLSYLDDIYRNNFIIFSGEIRAQL